MWQHSKVPVQIPTISLGEVVGVYESREGWFDFVLAKDEYLGNGDGIEPSLDPTPYSGKERRGTNDLS
jgi:hypothetical protein